MNKKELALELESAAKLIPSSWHQITLKQLALLIRERCLTPKGLIAAQEYLKLIQKEVDDDQ